MITLRKRDSQKNSWKKNLILASSGHFINDFYNGFLSPLLPIIVLKLDLSLISVGMLLSIFSISNSLLQPVGGLIADRLKRNYFVLFGPMLAGIFMSFIGLANQYWTLLLILCGSGIGTAIFHPQAAAMVGNLGNSRKGLAMSIFNTAGAFGVTVGSIFIIPYIDYFGIRSTIFTSIFVLIFIAFSFRGLMLKRPARIAKSNTLDIKKFIKSNWSLIFNLYLMVVFRATITLAFAGFIPLYLTSQGKSNFYGAIGLAVFQFFSVLGILIGGHVFDRVGAKKILLVSFVFILPFAVFFIYAPSVLGLVFLALLGFFLSSSTPVNIILGQRIAPNNASFMSALMMGFGWGVAGLLITPFGGLADFAGLKWALMIVSGLSLPGLVLVSKLKIHSGID